MSVQNSMVGLRVSFVPGSGSGLSDSFAQKLLESFAAQGALVQDEPNFQTDVVLTTQEFGRIVSWREAILFTGRRRFGLRASVRIFTILSAASSAVHALVDRFKTGCDRQSRSPGDFDFPGLAPNSGRVLFEQAVSRSPTLALSRLIQAQSKSIDTLLLVGEESLDHLFHFNLVGSHYRAAANQELYQHVSLRIAVSVRAERIADHEREATSVPDTCWYRSKVANAMCSAAAQFESRGFFSPMLKLSDLVAVPSFSDTISRQYSEGCFASWEPTLGGLMVTCAGNDAPFHKGKLNVDDLALVVGLRPNGCGVRYLQAAGASPRLPSSEAVELMRIDEELARVQLQQDNGRQFDVPIIRSKLHGHRGVRSYNPKHVEYCPIDMEYQLYPVSCATNTQAQVVKRAFAGAACLTQADDERSVAFTLVPGHGVMIVEKWTPDKEPFQQIWEFMDRGYLVIDGDVPQGTVSFLKNADQRIISPTSKALS